MNINPYAKGAASGAYEQGVKTAADYAGVTTQLAEITDYMATGTDDYGFINQAPTSTADWGTLE